MIWGIIPARAGSVGVKEKNVRILGGKPLYRWVLDSAVKSNLFSRIIVSTDINSILTDESYPSGLIEVQERPSELSQGGYRSMQKTVRYVLNQYVVRPDYFALMQPTSPFLRVEDIERCVTALTVLKGDDSCQTIRRVKHHDHAFNQRVVKDWDVVFAFPKQRDDVRKQAQPEHYAFGNIVVTKTFYFLETGDFFGNSTGIEIPWKYGIDIDYEEDLELAEAYLGASRINL